MNNNTNKLFSSPMYNLSLCSLENFHTSFLAWVIKNYPKEILSGLLGRKISNNTKINEINPQARYSKDVILDLEIIIQEDNKVEYIVIENKLKAYPKPEQLRKYQKCFVNKDATFILLSLAPAPNIADGWTFIDYNNLKGILQKITTFQNQYHEALIKDYIEVIEVIHDAFPKELTQKYDFYKRNALEDIGLKDIYVKYRTSELTQYIKDYINDENYFIDWSFHNKKGTIDIIKTMGDVEIGVQIEKEQYRYFIRAYNGTSKASEIRNKIAIELLHNGYWFNNTKCPSRTTNYDEFCGYAPDFIYRYLTVASLEVTQKMENVTYETIAQKVKDDLENLENYKLQIVKIIEKHSKELN